MADAEEFKITIDRDGRIKMDFRGMNEESYRRIVQMLEETVGTVKPLEVEAGEEPPPRLTVRGSGDSVASSEEEQTAR